MENTVLDTPTIPSLPNSEIDRIFALQKANQYKMASTTAKERKAMIKKIHDAMLGYRTQLQEAMYLDFKRPTVETDIADLYTVRAEAKHAMKHVARWMRPEPVPTPLSLKGSRSFIHNEPKGVVLIVAPWNYPIELSFGPLVSAIAAGNCAIIKPSEITPHTSSLIAKIVKDLYDEKEVAVIEGGIDVSTHLLKKPFNHIFFTGSPMIGKVVMRAAAENLASVTLELGGKSPVIIDETANINEAAQKIAWAKFLNNGQTCIAPDYIFVHESKKAEFVQKMKDNLSKMYGANEEERINTDSYCRIVNQKHFQRVKSLLDEAIDRGAQVAFGGSVDASQEYIEPTLLTGVDMHSRIMEEEIFGPLLPIHHYSNIDDVINYINEGEKPLALYVYSRKGKNAQRVLDNTRAGGGCINDCNLHFGNVNLPFGGSNNSGIGKSHGIYAFEEFTNKRGILKQPMTFSAIKMMLPPYTNTVKKFVDMTLRWL